MKFEDTPDTALLPRDAANGEPLPPSSQPGYYSGFRTLAQRAFWDEATRNTITMRVEQRPSIRYFTEDGARFWRAVFDHLIPQYDRTPEHRIPIIESIDDKLYRNCGIGYRYESMPPNREAYRLGQMAINEEATRQFGGDFLNLSLHQQDQTLKAIHDGRPSAAKAIWKQMAVRRFWQLLMQDVSEAYYSHPWAWDEIGFGGPAYPRAYTRLERGEPEPWEVEEHRYEWVVPNYAVSDVTEETHHLHTESDQNS
jgi:hypothetical protein